MVLDLIHTISMEVNFVTIQDPKGNDITSLPKGRSNRIHRLALRAAKVEHNPSIKMGHVRSFNATTCSDSGMPPLSIFKLLRVLVIEECDFLEGHSLEHLSRLVHLRYLGLVNTAVKLPEELGHDLKFLEILDVRGGFIRELPPSFGELKKLRCLWADAGTTLKGEIGKLTCLEELQLHEVDMCPNFFTDVGNLTKLRVLKIHCYEMDELASEDLVEFLCNLPTIHGLEVWCNCEYHPPVLGGSLEDLAPSSKLRSLCLEKIIIPTMPSWIGSFYFPFLSEVRLHVELIESRDFEALGRLPSLVMLFLEGDHKSMSYNFGRNEFPMLKWLVVKIEVTIGEGALPMLQILSYSASARRKKDVGSLVPWNNSFTFLDYVTCWLDCANVGNEKVKEVEAVLSDAANAHPKFLHLNIERENYDRKAGELIDKLELILSLGSLDRPEEVDRTADEENIRGMVT
jgi:disease resistance protein RPM1